MVLCGSPKLPQKLPLPVLLVYSNEKGKEHNNIFQCKSNVDFGEIFFKYTIENWLVS